MKNIFNKVKMWAAAHKIVSSIIVVVVIFGGYEIYKSFSSGSTQTLYQTTAAEKGTIVSAVSGSGQVSASNQVDIKSKVSGTVLSVPAQSGNEISSGALILSVDSTDASIALSSAQSSYDKFVEAPDPTTLASDKAAIAKAYTDAWNTVASVFTSYPSTILNMDNLYYQKGGYLNSQGLSGGTDNIYSVILNSGVSYDAAKAKYNSLLITYNSLSPSSATSSIASLTADTYSMLLQMSAALKNTQNAIIYIAAHSTNESNSTANQTALASVNSMLDSINSDLSSVVSAQNSITSSENALADLLKGPDVNDLKVEQLSLLQKQNTLSDYYIRAPFDGMLTKLSIQPGNVVNTGDSVATILSKNQVANIALNEVDAAKVKVGQKATMTFDAIDGLSISGTVADVDLVGTVSQGVVTYNVKIAFDTTDPRVRSGMTANASIITDVRQDVIIVPIASVKTSGSSSYVEVFDSPIGASGTPAASAVAPRQVQVTVGASNDTYTEIISGVNEGDNVVSKTSTNTVKTTTSTAPSLFGSTSGRAAGGGARGVSTP